MAASRGRKRRSGGILRAIGRFILLIGLGFGLGLVIGVVSEEPDLVYGHLTGEGESVRLADDSGSATEESILVERARAQSGSSVDRIAAGSADDSNGIASNGIAIEGASSDQDLAQASRAESQPARLGLRGGAEEQTGLSKVAAAPPVAQANEGANRPGESPRRIEADRKDDRERWAIQVGAFSDEATARRLVKSLESKRYPVAVVPANDSIQNWRVRVQPVRGEDKARAVASRLKGEEGLPTWLISMDPGSR